ncbi:hypothetical protein JHW43_008045 [Diplocarpon mali]|nr:hypothetical protein JHW43_008045 [Diplocarpon mali]
MDLLSSIRKEGSRGGVNFSWDDVQTSQHRENYLGHSLMAPVGRWQKNRDLSWYAKGDDGKGENGETAEERRARERKAEIKRIKEAEEDALARALGLPVAERGTGSNSISVGEVHRAVKEAGIGEDDGDVGFGKGKSFGGFVGSAEEGDRMEGNIRQLNEGGLSGRGAEKQAGEKDSRKRVARSHSRERTHRHRHRSRSGERNHRPRSRDRYRERRPREEREERRPRDRSVERKERRHRSRSPDRARGRPDRQERRDREKPRRNRTPERTGRSWSPMPREYRRRGE